MQNWISLALAVGAVLVGACAKTYGPDIAPEKAALMRGAGDCEVTLDIRYWDNEDTDASVPAEWKKRPESGVWSDPICVKRAGEAIELPRHVPLRVSDSEGHHYCTKDSKERSKNGKEPCDWTLEWMDSNPLSFRFMVVAGEPSRQKLSDHIGTIQVVRNSVEAWAWDKSVQRCAHPWRDGREVECVLIPGKKLRDNYMPQYAPFGLYVGRGGSRASEPVKAELRKGLESRLDKIKRGLKDFNEEMLRVDPGWAAIVGPATELFDAARCVRRKLEDAVGKLKDLASGEAFKTVIEGLGGLPGNKCSANGKTYQPFLEELFAQANTAYEELLEKLGTAWNESLDPDALRRIIERLLEKARKEFRTTAVYTHLERMTRDRDPGSEPAKNALDALEAAERWLGQLAEDTRQGFRGVVGLVKTAVSEGAKIVKEPERLAMIYTSFASKLPSADSFFKERKENPAPSEGMDLLKMRYRDTVQFFMFSSRHVVPLAFSGHFAKTELSAVNAVPIVSIFGWRIQTRGSWVADLRVNLVGLGFTQDQERRSKAEGWKDGPVRPFIELGSFDFLRGFSVGVGLVIRPEVPGGGDWWGENFRLSLGVDLIKLTSGADIEWEPDVD